MVIVSNINNYKGNIDHKKARYKKICIYIVLFHLYKALKAGKTKLFGLGIHRQEIKEGKEGNEHNKNQESQQGAEGVLFERGGCSQGLAVFPS